MTEQQHEHHESIIASMHVHASHDRCVEVVVMRGNYKNISTIAQEMIAETGIEDGITWRCLPEVTIISTVTSSRRRISTDTKRQRTRNE